MAARRHPPSPRFSVADSAMATMLDISERASNKLRVLAAVVRSRAFHSGWPNFGTNGWSAVPMDNPGFMGSGECAGHLDRDVNSFTERDKSAHQALPQRFAFDQFAGDVMG